MMAYYLPIGYLILVLDFQFTPHKEWFSTYSSRRLGCMQLVDDSTCDIVGAGDV